MDDILKELDTTTKQMVSAESDLAEAVLKLAEAEFNLRDKEIGYTLDAIREGTLGKNDLERKANLENYCTNYIVAVHQASMALTVAKADHAIAKANLDRVKYSIRYLAWTGEQAKE